VAARLRPLLTAVVALTGTALLGGCQKPTPLVTVVAAGRTFHVEASGWCVDGTCTQFAREVPVVTVHGNDVVGVDVDRSVARGTWAVSLESGNQSGIFATGRDSHYATFLAPDPRQVGTSDLLMRVSVQKSETGRDKDRVGQWFFRLKLT